MGANRKSPDLQPGSLIGGYEHTHSYHNIKRGARHMIILESYQELIGEIELLEWLHEDLVRQLQRNEKDVWGHVVYLPKALAQYDNIIAHMRNIEHELDIKRELKRRIDERLATLGGVEYKIFFKQKVEGKTLHVIAAELHCSYSYVSKISSKINYERKVKDTVEKM